MSNITIIKSKLNRGLALTQQESWELYKYIKVLEQEPKTGHWIYDYTSADGHRTYHCSECGCFLKPKHSEFLSDFKWCSLCGAKMIEPQESRGEG